MTRLVLFVLLACTIAISACDDDGDGVPTPTATSGTTTPVISDPATSVPSGPEGGSADGFREFAARIQRALDDGDAAFFTDRVELQTGICTEEDVAGGIGAAPCEEVGAPWEGFLSGQWRSEGFILPSFSGESIARLWLEALASESDEFGDGLARVYALGLGTEPGAAVLTALIERPDNFAGEGPLRTVVVTWWRFDGERWLLISTLNASVVGEEFLIPCEEALNYLGGGWERYPDRSQPPGDPADCPI